MAKWEEIKHEAEALIERYQREVYKKPDAWDWLKTYLAQMAGRTLR